MGPKATCIFIEAGSTSPENWSKLASVIARSAPILNISLVRRFRDARSAFGKDVVAVEFTALLPWVLQETWDQKSDCQLAKVDEIINRYPKTLKKLAEPDGL
jgi:hypothetical protein